MKNLIFLRHAKSNWDSPVSDRNRSLSSSGVKAIQQVALHWKDIFSAAQCIMSSPANRALHTATILAHTVGYDMNKIKIDEALYTFSSSDIISYIKRLDDVYDHLLLVGHNPAFSEVTQELSSNNVPELNTACWAQLTFEAKHWSEIKQGTSINGSRKSLSNL